jgi:glycosyltransferase involved in cell wall biosynthesis
MSNLKISIITVCYNAEANIQETIESVLAQDYDNVEYIIIDGKSSDKTVNIIEKFKGKLTYISEPDKGIYDAINKGLKLAAGDIIGIIGADDFYPSPDVLSTVADTFQKSETEAVYGDKQYVNPDDTKKIVRYWKSGLYNIENWLNGWMPPHLSFYLKKSVYDKYGHYKTDFTCSGDYELMLRMLYKNKVSAVYIPKVLMTMRNGGTSTASWKHRLKANMEDRKAWEINGLKPRWYTLLWKPLSKVTQLLNK